ncbi:hypothetical protein B0T19DRAFT_297954 [Cercophora scortea]|uniref:Uncharacterized protein n=1 Tax=Cercophora scortea TaxID=314031 RepID=A0AAE0I390_9PEZI|nr:hypothetical protein B0T19DRAFT_297954 [Cercophora scortea]
MSRRQHRLAKRPTTTPKTRLLAQLISTGVTGAFQDIGFHGAVCVCLIARPRRTMTQLHENLRAVPYVEQVLCICQTLYLIVSGVSIWLICIFVVVALSHCVADRRPECLVVSLPSQMCQSFFPWDDYSSSPEPSFIEDGRLTRSAPSSSASPRHRHPPFHSSWYFLQSRSETSLADSIWNRPPITTRLPYLP